MKVKASRTARSDEITLNFEHRERGQAWTSTETWTWAELESLGWDGTADGLRSWLRQRMAERRKGPDFQGTFGPTTRVLPELEEAEA